MNKLTDTIEHIFFDLDHTLWDFETNSDKTFEQIFKKHAVQVDTAEFKTVYRPINVDYWKLFREEKVTKSELRYGRLKDTFDALGIETDDALIHLLSEEYINYLPFHTALFKGAEEVLDYLQKRYRMHIITNGFEEVQHKKMSHSGLLPFFETIITSEAAGVKKPHPGIFEYALEKTGATPQNSIMIGDNLEADILGARDVGMHTIFCKFNGESAPEDIVSVSELAQLKQLL